MNDPKFAIPDRVAFDADGYGWRVFDGDDGATEPTWSMVPVNPDNSPIPQPCTFFVNDDLLREALNENDQEKQVLMAECVRLRAELAELKAEAALNEEGWRRELAELRTAAQAVIKTWHSAYADTGRFDNTVDALIELLKRGNQ